MSKIPLFEVYWDNEDIEAVTGVVRRGSYWADGPDIGEFEDAISEYANRKHAVVFNNGTTALHALMLAYGIGRGDEVIVPSFTFISTANAPVFTGAKPVFADIEPVTCGLDPERLEERITENTRAIIPVHYGGHPCMIDALKDIAEDRNILLLEDAAESLGAGFRGKMVGSFGDAAMFSFCQNKIITTGEGGAIVTEDEELARKLRLIRSHGRSTGNYFDSGKSADYIALGYNMRMPSICAALGISQLAKIEEIIERRRSIAKKFNAGLSAISGINGPAELEGCRHVYQLYSVLLSDGDSRNGLKEHLDARGIMSKVYFDPVHQTEFYRMAQGFGGNHLPVTEDISKRILTLPLYPGMSESEANHVLAAIEEYLGE